MLKRQFVIINSVDSTGATHSLILCPFKPTSGRLNFLTLQSTAHRSQKERKKKKSEIIDEGREEGEVSNERGEGVTMSDRGKKGRDMNDRGREKQEGGEKMGGL